MDRFGYGSQPIHEPVDMREETDKMLRSAIRLIERFMPNIDDKTKQRFVESGLKEKQSILQRFANDTDDALWRSDEWMYLTGANSMRKNVNEMTEQEYSQFLADNKVPMNVSASELDELHRSSF